MRRWPAVASCAALLALLWLWLWLWSSMRGPPTPGAGLPVPPQAVPAAAPVPQARPVPAAVAVALPSAAPQTAASAPELPLVDVCGVGMVRLQAAPPAVPPLDLAEPGPAAELPAHLGEHAYAAARQRLLAALHAGAPRQQALGWMIDDAPAAALQAGPALAALARSTQDPVIWRWAMARCANGPDCDGLQAAEWARADPGNAAPWLQLLDVNPAAAGEAWQGLVQATRLQSFHGVLSATALQAWPADAPAYLASTLFVDVMGIEAALPLPTFAAALKRCRQAARDSPTHAQCDAIVRMLTQGSDDVLGFYIGLGMAERAGWPAPTLAPLRAVRNRLKQQPPAPAWLAAPWSCDGVAQLTRDAVQMAEQGELATLLQRADAASAARRRGR